MASNNRVYVARGDSDIPSVSNAVGHLRIPHGVSLSSDSPRRLTVDTPQHVRRSSLSTVQEIKQHRARLQAMDRADGNAFSNMLNGRLGFKRRMRNRLMQKNGCCNIQLANVPKQSSKYFNDIFTTIIEVKWRWCLCMFASSYIISWLFFTLIFYVIALAHGDFEPDHTDESTWPPCVANGHSFLAMLMFSVESQSTIGYGNRYPTEECPALVIVVFVQNMLGVMIQSLMAGVVFAKLARPKKRAQTILFSKHAVVCKRDGQLCLLFRLGDMRQSVLAEAHVRLQMVKKNVTEEGELQPFHQFDMSVGYDTGTDRVFIIWPITICHVIDKDSPFYDISQADLASGEARFELIAILEGVVESTGSTTQARTSYLPSEIIWGHRYEKLVTYQRDNGDYRIDFSLFHSTYPCECPVESAKQLDDMEENGSSSQSASERTETDMAVAKANYYTVPNLNYTKRPSVKQLLEPLHESYRITSPDRSTNSTGSTVMEDDSMCQAVPVDMSDRKLAPRSRSSLANNNRSKSPPPSTTVDKQKKKSSRRSSLDVEAAAAATRSPNYVVTSSSLERQRKQNGVPPTSKRAATTAAARQPSPSDDSD